MVDGIRDPELEERLARFFEKVATRSEMATEGGKSIRARLRRDLDNARWFADQVAATPDWCVLAPVTLQTVCIRHQPEGLEGEALDRHTLAWVGDINQSGGCDPTCDDITIGDISILIDRLFIHGPDQVTLPYCLDCQR